MAVPSFNFNVLVDLLLDEDDPNVQLVAGSALAAFAYNSVDNQRRIATAGVESEKGLTFKHYTTMMAVKNEEIRAHASFQVSRVLDNEYWLVRVFRNAPG